ncbi:DUF6642 family protein [Xanthomarina sp. GH4-25]|uniref:DUF6642 family protein n=1 Tax=Xanthomarina sp. GH4-25 TaxID=3349335 RepID=UPI003877B5EF
MHKTCITKKELKSRVSIIIDGDQKSYARFKIIYFAFHGKGSQIDLGVENISLSKLSKYFEDAFSNRIVHFGSCKTIFDENEVTDFLEKTNALAVTGYSKNVDFIPSTVLDILFFEECQKWKNIKKIKQKMESKYSQLIDDLGFKIYF